METRIVTDKATAWESLSFEKKLPLNMEMHSFRFTKRWFISRNLITFSTFLPRWFSNDEPVNQIQIGVFEGMDLVWQFQNILGHSESRSLAIDPWMATRKLDEARMTEVMGNAHHNLVPWRKQVEIRRGFSGEILEEVVEQSAIAIHGKPIPRGGWDLVVIDGDHNQDPVLKDAELALQLLRVGGVLLFDDVRNNITKKRHVASGIRKFLKLHGDEVEFLMAHRYCNAYRKIA